MKLVWFSLGRLLIQYRSAAWKWRMEPENSSRVGAEHARTPSTCVVQKTVKYEQSKIDGIHLSVFDRKRT